jgi:hypothetical protein
MRNLLLSEEGKAIEGDIRVGGNDKYLVKKLRQYQITSQRVNNYI